MSLKGKLLIAKQRSLLSGIELKGPEAILVGSRNIQISPGDLMLCLGGRNANQLIVLIGDNTWRIEREKVTGVVPDSRFAGMSFCFTGPGEQDRAYYKALVELHEGTYESGVTRSTSYLISGPWIGAKQASTKLKAAKNWRIPILSYEQFKEMAE